MPTANEGANKERSAWLAKLRREGKTSNVVLISDLIAWGLQRNERYNAKKGGLGKK